ncbi:MAG: hypothetical protein DMF57_11695 [Acidobacteria bacterium]|nr:MAG: hypothetical protein DMF57_11695 [Acidobacteriota bacterium]
MPLAEPSHQRALGRRETSSVGKRISKHGGRSLGDGRRDEQQRHDSDRPRSIDDRDHDGRNDDEEKEERVPAAEYPGWKSLRFESGQHDGRSHSRSHQRPQDDRLPPQKRDGQQHDDHYRPERMKVRILARRIEGDGQPLQDVQHSASNPLLIHADIDALQMNGTQVE